jgi:protein-S-isoprenylcysteine O-methyltransferase Ste14
MWNFLTFRLLVGGFVIGYVPYSILSSHPEPAPALLSILTITAVFLIAAGVYVYLRCVWDFAFGGESDNPTMLIARGTYKFVRNPMYTSLVLILLGESLLFRSWRLFGYAAAFWFAVHLLVILYEEQALAKKFGTSYEQYCKEVPRWIPRVRRSAS